MSGSDVVGKPDEAILTGASDDPAASTDHEATHALRALNLFTPEESTVPERAARALYPDLDAAAQLEEAIAEAFAEAMKRPERRTKLARGAIRRAFSRIVRFFRAMTAWPRDQKNTTEQDIFAAVAGGRAGARKAQGARGGAADQSLSEDTRIWRDKLAKHLWGD